MIFKPEFRTLKFFPRKMMGSSSPMGHHRVANSKLRATMLGLQELKFSMSRKWNLKRILYKLR